MKTFIQWVFIIGSFVFLYWYLPEALKDNQVTPFEIAVIAFNFLCFVINFTNYLERKV